MRGTMRLVEPTTALLECSVCGCRHQGQIRPHTNGKLYRKNWKCQFGCSQVDVEQN